MNILSPRLRYLGLAASVAMCAGASAQSAESLRAVCHYVGASTSEPLGGAEGHALSVTQIACRTEGGLLGGGILTGTTIWEFNKNNAVGLSSSGVVRKPGALAVYQNSEAKLTRTVADGAVTGITGSGRGQFTLATGSAAALNGKTYSYTFKSSGPGQMVLDLKLN